MFLPDSYRIPLWNSLVSGALYLDFTTNIEFWAKTFSPGWFKVSPQWPTSYGCNYDQIASRHMAGRGHWYICSLWVMRDGIGNVFAHKTLLTCHKVTEHLLYLRDLRIYPTSWCHVIIVIAVTSHNDKVDAQLPSCRWNLSFFSRRKALRNTPSIRDLIDRDADASKYHILSHVSWDM